MTTMKHPKTGHTTDVGEAQIPFLRAAGWLPTEPPDDRPAESATKSEWVDYAVSQGWDREEAEAATKADLTEQL